MMKRVIFKSVFLFCFIISLLSCKNEKEGKQIKVGVILPMTGSLSRMGEMERNAMLLAVEKLNEKSQKSVNLYFEDNQSKSTNAVSAANKLININKVDVIITSTTGASLSVQPLLKGKNILHVAFCMDTEVSSLSPNSIRPYMGLEQEIRAILNYLKDSEGRNIAVLCCKIPAYETLVNNYVLPYFQKNTENRLMYVDYYELNQTDFRNIALQLKNKNINELILLGYGFEYHNIYKHFEEQNILKSLNVIGGWGFLYTEIDRNLLDETLVAGPEYVFRTNSLAEDFKRDFIKKYQIVPNFDAAFAYETIMKLPKFNGIGIDSLKNYLLNFSVNNSIVGAYHFDENGNMIMKEVGLGIYKNGELSRIDGKNK